MNYKISFQERAKLAKQILSKQLPTTLEEASAKTQGAEHSKEEETESLILFINDNQLWCNCPIDENDKIVAYSFL